MPRKHRKQRGQGPIWDKVKEVAGKVNNFLKSSKIISKGAALASTALPEFAPVLGAVSTGASSLGYGRRGRHTRRMHGGAPMSVQGVLPGQIGIVKF